MRSDFNKLLTERERYGSDRSFHSVRHSKQSAADDYYGGRQSMKKRHRLAQGRGHGLKQFNENLNPLKNFLRVNVGRPWDKIYSEIRTNFDARKVINNHILEHLFQYVEKDVKIIDGKPHVLFQYRGGGKWEHVSESYSDYYIDPRDGIMKETKRNETKRRREARQAEKTEQLLHKVKRVIDGGTELHRLNGIWYVIEIKDVPPPRIEYQMPYGWNIADRIRWRNMTDAERVEHGTRREVHDHHPMSLESDDGEAYKYIDHQRFKYSHGWNATLFKKYYASKVTASAKILKEHGLVGTALHDDDVGVLSHRERSKYRE